MHKHKHNSKAVSHTWGPWSEWAWDESRRRWYRVRRDTNGALDYDWDNRQTPREVEQLTQDLGNLSPGSSYDAHGMASRPRRSVVTAADAYHAAAADESSYTVSKDKSKSSTKTSSSSKSKGKGHRSYDDVDDSARAPYRAVPSSSSAHHSKQYHDAKCMYSSHIPTLSYQLTLPDAGYEKSSSAYYGQSSSAGEVRTLLSKLLPLTPLALAIPLDPRATTKQAYSGGSSSRNVSSHGRDPTDEELRAAMSRSLYYAERSAAPGPSSAAYGPYYDDDDDGPPTPKAPRITADEELLEEMDPRASTRLLPHPITPNELIILPGYRVQHSSRFNPGEIFKVHWSEPEGSGNEHAPSVSGRHETQNRFGTKFYVGFRRFIVIANEPGHSICVQVYPRCKKRGLKPAKHGVVHERGHRPRLLEGEPKLGFTPIRVDMTEEGEKLSKESRVNYSKLVTVEHNVKVFFIGSVVANDWDIVQEAVNRCWSEKDHRNRRSR
ncbi:hypothetical protein L249_0424 [Ophiocordyceps polyrhachis-furcata BCC 54312]|uniref:DUF6590 domain-containing protein n=1 Tax=Ophiocordyceps polyrhachis-furcata BCC 54312 TaxID=1330021 RepID=A0A367LFI1_9HYPO|nr:hypothetical protein L249_0424 [Ophiocordyceps polyrhachis-furcata BCC 54312]